MKFSVYQYTNHDLRSNKGYVNSYRFESADLHKKMAFDYHAKNLIPLHNEIIALDNTRITITPQKQGMLSNEVAISRNKKNIAYYDYNKKIIYDENHSAIVYIIDPSNPAKAVLRTALQGDPPVYRLVDKSKKHNYGHIRRVKIKTTLWWPLSIIENLVKVIVIGGKKALYELESDNLPIDIEIVMFAIAVLEENKSSSQPAL